MVRFRTVALYGGLALGELSATAYLAFTSYLMSTWMMNDDLAFRMSEHDWWMEGGKRLLLFTFVGFVFASVSYFLNWRVFGPVGLGNKQCLGWSIVLAAVIICASLAGATEFVINKPFM